MWSTSSTQMLALMCSPVNSARAGSTGPLPHCYWVSRPCFCHRTLLAANRCIRTPWPQQHDLAPFKVLPLSSDAQMQRRTEMSAYLMISLLPPTSAESALSLHLDTACFTNMQHHYRGLAVLAGRTVPFRLQGSSSGHMTTGTATNIEMNMIGPGSERCRQFSCPPSASSSSDQRPPRIPILGRPCGAACPLPCRTNREPHILQMQKQTRKKRI